MTFLSWTEAETRPPPSANNRDVDRKARVWESLATLLPLLLVLATKAFAARCDIVAVAARNMIPMIEAMDDDNAGDFIVVFGFFLPFEIRCFLDLNE